MSGRGDRFRAFWQAVASELPLGEPTSRSAWKRTYKRLRTRLDGSAAGAVALAITPIDGDARRVALEPGRDGFGVAQGRDVSLRLRTRGATGEGSVVLDFGAALQGSIAVPCTFRDDGGLARFRLPRGLERLVVVLPYESAPTTIDEAVLEPSREPLPESSVHAALASLDAIGGLIPASGIAFDDVRARFRSIGPDPQFRLAEPRLHAGFYLLEVDEEFDGPRCHARLYARTGREYAESDAFVLPLRTGQLAKRVVYLRDRPRAMRFDPIEHASPFVIRHLSLRPLTERFAYALMLKKLAQGDVARVRRALESDAKVRGIPPSMLAFERYDRGFQARSAPMIRYEDWIAVVEPRTRPAREAVRDRLAKASFEPTVSIVVPVYEPAEAHLRACLDSVLAQTYARWELCVADDASASPHVRAVLDEYAARDPRVRVTYRARNGRIAAASNDALVLATGDFVALLDHDDVLDPDALLLVVDAFERNRDAAIVYTDEDKLDPDGNRWEPHFKPDWNRELFYGLNYVSHLGVYRRDLVTTIGGFHEGFDGSQDYDLFLRCLDRIDGSQIVHVPHVLYHWRMTEQSMASSEAAKDYTTSASLRALEAHFLRRGETVRLSSPRPNFFRVHRPLPVAPPRVSVIVPTRDGGDVLRRAIDSIRERTTYREVELMIVDNQSVDSATLAYLAELDGQPGVRVLRYDAPFNFSAINNFAVREASGSVLAFVNDDVEVITPEWLSELVALALVPTVGCVGAKLYYPNDTIQHAGVIVGLGGVAGHSHKHITRASAGYFGRLSLVQELSAVTGACLVVRKDVFDELGGFDEADLAVAFNDVDLCLKARAAGYRNVFTPFAELYHYESVSRGRDDSPEKQARFAREIDAMKTRWGDALQVDPAYNPNLTQDREDFTISSRPRHRRP